MIFTSSTKNTGQKIVNISFYNQQVIGEVANSNAFTGRTSKAGWTIVALISPEKEEHKANASTNNQTALSS